MANDEVPQARRRNRVNEMPNGRPMSEEASVNIGALQQRVFGLENSQRNLADSLSSLASRVETLFAGLATKIEERSKPQYNLLISIGVFGLGVIIAVGSQALSPLRESQTDLKAAMIEMTKSIAATNERANERFAAFGDRFVSIRELEGRGVRTQAELARLNTDITSQEVNLRRSIEQGDANLQRQIDDQKKQFGDTFSLRDALLQMQRRIDQLEAARRGS